MYCENGTTLYVPPMRLRCRLQISKALLYRLLDLSRRATRTRMIAHERLKPDEGNQRMTRYGRATASKAEERFAGTGDLVNGVRTWAENISIS